MGKKSNGSFDLILYSVGLALAFLAFYISKWMAAPLLNKVESGTPLVEIIFNQNDKITFLWNMMFPTIMLLVGIGIFIVLLWQMGRAILLKRDSRFNKILLILIASVVFIDLCVAIMDSWDLLIINFQYILILLVLLTVIGYAVKFVLHPKK
nr:hypothetical protein [Lysinibacillus timonensis]